MVVMVVKWLMLAHTLVTGRLEDLGRLVGSPLVPTARVEQIMACNSNPAVTADTKTRPHLHRPSPLGHFL